MASKANELMQIGLRLSNCRQNRNMTQEELAGRLGITPQAVSKWERGTSLPDISMLADLAGILEVSTDWLLGIQAEQGSQSDGKGSAGDAEIESQKLPMEAGSCMRNCLPPLELIFGKDIVPLFQGDGSWASKIFDFRAHLATEGAWLPVVRIRDELALGEKEFMILSFHNILYSETLDALDEGTMDYMISKLRDTVHEKYHEILHPDLVKNIVDNLKIEYPALIEDIVPEKISYGLLTETAKLVLAKGNSLCYLPKMIEIMECALRRNPAADAQALAAQIIQGICRNDNFYVVTRGRQAGKAETGQEAEGRS